MHIKKNLLYPKNITFSVRFYSNRQEIYKQLKALENAKHSENLFW